MDTMETLIARLDAQLRMARDLDLTVVKVSVQLLRDAAHALSGATPVESGCGQHAGIPIGTPCGHCLLKRIEDLETHAQELAAAALDYHVHSELHSNVKGVDKTVRLLEALQRVLSVLTPVAPTTPEQEKQPNPCLKCGTFLWGDARPCWNCKREASVSPSSEGWQPIATAPKDGTTVLICRYMQPFGWVMGHAQYHNIERIGGAWVARGFGLFGELGLAAPTHWMPLPAPPASAGTDKSYDLTII